MKLKAIYCDAWTSGNPGIGGARVTDVKGSTLDEWNSGKEIHSNNFYELVGISLAVRYAIKHDIKVIYSDSMVGMSWARKGMPGKSVKVDREKITLRASIVKQRVSEHKIEIKKWETHTNGDIPADYGRKS